MIMKEKGKNMKTIYKKPTIQCIVLGSHIVMCAGNEIEIDPDNPVNPGRGANNRRGQWGDLWE